MQIRKLLNYFILHTILTCCVFTSSYGIVVTADYWWEFGNQTLYSFASKRCSLPQWLQCQQQLVDALAKPDLRKSVLAVESFIERATEGYEQDNFVWLGRAGALDLQVAAVAP